MMETVAENRQAGIDAARVRAAVYRTFGLALQRPTEETFAAMWRVGGVFTGEASVPDAPNTSSGATASSTLKALRLALCESPDPPELAERYDGLFGHTARGLVCACETEYGAEAAFHQPHQLADIAGFYRAFGLRPDPTAGMRVDHIACECEFMSFLALKEAHVSEALESPQTSDIQPLAETLDLTRHAARGFMADHLARFSLALSSRLVTADPDGFYGRVGRGLARFLEGECERLAVEAGPPTLQLRPEQPDDTPMACGTGDDLIQIGRREDYR